MSTGAKASHVNLKIIILGNASVGKSSLLARFVDNSYSNVYRATIGADFRNRDLVISDRRVSCSVWDSSGAETFFNSLGVSYYRGAHVCLLVYDVCDLRSLHDLDAWRNDFLSTACPAQAESFPFIVVGNKIDKASAASAAVIARAEAYCARFGYPHFKTSAKTGEGVFAAFLEAASQGLTQERAVSEATFTPENLVLRVEEPVSHSQKKNCCKK